LLKQLTAEQLTEWAVYFNLEPEADRRADSLAAQLLAMTGNINRSEEAKPFTPNDFMPWIESPKEVSKEVDPRENYEKMYQLFSSKGK
jgi:hypothetical protein